MHLEVVTFFPLIGKNNLTENIKAYIGNLEEDFWKSHCYIYVFAF